MLPNVKLFFVTRLTVRYESLDAIEKNYQCLMALFDWATHNTSDPDMKARLIGVSHQMTTFEYYFGLKLTKLIFCHCDYLSKAMQAKELPQVSNLRRIKNYLRSRTGQARLNHLMLIYREELDTLSIDDIVEEFIMNNPDARRCIFD